MTFAALQVALPNGRFGRIFASTVPALRDEMVTRFAETFVDEEDAPREEHLRALFREGTALAWLHPSDDQGEVVRVYLQSTRGGPKRFACVVVSRQRIEAMLTEAPLVFEGFSLQVVDVRHLTTDALLAAVEAWAERCLPDAETPTFIMRSWTEESGVGLSAITVLPGVNAWSHRVRPVERAIASDDRPTPGTNRRLPPPSAPQALP